jgi:flagellar basal body L-ring protein FlgH
MMAGETDAPAEELSAPAPAERTSIFIPKEALGERAMKVGDTITLTIKDIDPDTGEVEAESGSEEAAEVSSTAGAIDAMPDME